MSLDVRSRDAVELVLTEPGSPRTEMILVGLNFSATCERGLILDLSCYPLHSKVSFTRTVNITGFFSRLRLIHTVRFATSICLYFQLVVIRKIRVAIVPCEWAFKINSMQSCSLHTLVSLTKTMMLTVSVNEV